jgi:hypothetical protein
MARKINLPKRRISPEDNTKRDRLEYFKKLVEYDRPEFMAQDLRITLPYFKNFLDQAGDEQCALRLLGAKLRVRGKTLRENLVWFKIKTSREQYSRSSATIIKYSATFNQ